ncbi:MAG: NADH-quinone oxidoreductase subunit NuoK [Bacteroidaceae bacterium]
MEIQLQYYLVVSCFMLACGIFGFFVRRNTLAMLIAVELMLNAADINFAAFNRYLFNDALEGHFFTLFGIAIAAAETAVAVAIMINLYRNLNSIQTKDIEDMKH